MYRPIPLGTSEIPMAGGIRVCCGFCSWPCARAYADQNYPSDEVERLTTKIMLEFKLRHDAGDDLDGWKFLQKYDRFSQMVCAPPRHAFAPYGELTHEKFRESWASPKLPSTVAPNSFGSMVFSSPFGAAAKAPSSSGFRGEIQSSSTEGAIIASDVTPSRAVQRITGYSTRRQYRPSAGLNRTVWPSLDEWNSQYSCDGNQYT